LQKDNESGKNTASKEKKTRFVPKQFNASNMLDGVFEKAYSVFQNEVCIETIMSKLKKCEAGVAALIGDNDQLLQN
jgi:hypothetical protein